MKTVLVLVWILAISASVRAGIIELQVTGVGRPGYMQSITPTHEIALAPYDYIWIDVIYNPAGGAPLFAVDVYLEVRGTGTVSFTNITYPTGAWDLSWPGTGGFTDVEGPYVTVNAGVFANGVAEGIVVDHILFCYETCEEVFINPVLTENHGGSLDFEGNIPTVGYGVIIPETPEPATLSLLFLGVLAARKRKRNET